MDRSQLLSTYAEYLLSPPIPGSPEKAEGGAVGDMSVEEWELRKQELELRKKNCRCRDRCDNRNLRSEGRKGKRI